MSTEEQNEFVSLREKARKCRRLADAISDSAAREQLDLFARELALQAARLQANVRAAETHSTIAKQIAAELKDTSRQAKDAARHAREHPHRLKKNDQNDLS
jgi:hypothetical protein